MHRYDHWTMFNRYRMIRQALDEVKAKETPVSRAAPWLDQTQIDELEEDQKIAAMEVKYCFRHFKEVAREGQYYFFPPGFSHDELASLLHSDVSSLAGQNGEMVDDSVGFDMQRAHSLTV